MARVFLSYSREDRARILPLAEAIEAAGHSVWWDRKIAGGAEYSGEIEAQLEQADAVLVAWSHTSARSAWVRDEAAFARDQGKLLPVVLDDGGPPLGFRQIHAVDLRGWNGNSNADEFGDLLEAIAIRAGTQGSRATAPSRMPLHTPPPVPADDGQRRKRTLKIGALILFALIFSKCVSDGDQRDPDSSAQRPKVTIETEDGRRVVLGQSPTVQRKDASETDTAQNADGNRAR